jgi:hypothetical protein
LGEPLRGLAPARVGLSAPSPSPSLLRSFGFGGSATIPLARAPLVRGGVPPLNMKYEIPKKSGASVCSTLFIYYFIICFYLKDGRRDKSRLYTLFL